MFEFFSCLPDETDPKEVAQVLVLENLLVDLIHKCHCARCHCYGSHVEYGLEKLKKAFLRQSLD